MDAVVQPGQLSGSVRAIPSKSVAHRLMICATLADKPTILMCEGTSDDIEATARCLGALGANVARTSGSIRVSPISLASPDAAGETVLDCGESGSTLRFLLPVAAALGRPATLIGSGRLPERPLSPLWERLAEHGALLEGNGSVPVTLGGKLEGGIYLLPGDISSQYVTGLLLAAPLTGQELRVVVTEPVQSRPYIDLTLDAMALFGVRVECASIETPAGPALELVCPAGSAYTSPGELAVEGDWSAAAFWLAAGALSSEGVEVVGLNGLSRQGDRAMLALLARTGARVGRSGSSAGARCDRLAASDIDASDFPDLVPPIALVAALSEGTTRITGAERLRLKESDRLESIASALNALGGDVRIADDGLTINGVETLEGGRVDAANDHRIAMMAAIAAARCETPVTIIGAECVSKSYPAFFDDLASLGAKVEMGG